MASSGNRSETDLVEIAPSALWTWARVIAVIAVVAASFLIVWRGNVHVQPNASPSLLIPLLTATSAIVFVLTALTWAVQKSTPQAADYGRT